MPTRLSAIAAAVLALGLGLASASAETVYRRGAAGEPETLDPAKTATVVEADALYDLFEGLVSYDAKGAIVPGVAAHWSVSADGLSYVFTLRDSLWSNGDPVTADDFVFSLRRLLDPATGAQYANLFYAIRNGAAVNAGKAAPDTLGVVARDPHTLEIDLERPTPYMLGLLAHQTAMPVHPASVAKFGREFTRPGNLVSNGPYALTVFNPNDRIEMVRNPRFHEADKVKIDREIILTLEDRAAALRRFEAGEIDSYPDAPADQIPYIRAHFGDEFHVAPSLGVMYFAFNTRKPPFSDARVRRALSMTIDRDFLAEKIWGGVMLPGYSLVPPGVDNYGKPVEPDFAALAPIDAEDQAKALLAQAGYGPGGKPLTVEIRYNTSENNKATAVAIADMWKPLGVTTSLVNTDLKTHYALLRDGGDYEVARAGWIGDYSDPENFLFLLKSDNAGLNYAHWSNADYDARLAKADATADLTARAGLLAEAEAIALKEQPFAPVLFYSSRNLVAKRVVGWEPNLLDRHLTRYLDIRR